MKHDKPFDFGPNQVFLKYYHIEQLSQKFEHQQRRIVIAQAVHADVDTEKTLPKTKEGHEQWGNCNTEGCVPFCL